MEFHGKRDYAAMVQGTKASNQSSSTTYANLPLREGGDVKKDKVEVQIEEVKTENKTDHLTALPADVTLNILKYLSTDDLYHCAQMCHGLSAVTDDEKLWKGIWEGLLLREPALKTLHEEPHEEVCYKDLCKGFMLTKQKWKTGEGVKTLTQDLLTNNLVTGADGMFRGDRLATSNRYILATTYESVEIYVFSAVDGKYLYELKGLPGYPRVLLLTQDEQMAAACSGKVACVWKVETSELLHSFDHPQPVFAMALHGAMLAVGFIGGVFVWSLDSGQRVQRLDGLEAAASMEYTVVLKGQHMAVYNSNAVLQLCDAKSGSVLFTLRNQYITKVLLDTASHSVVGLHGLAIKVWDMETGTRRGTITRTNDQYYQAMVVQNGKLIVYSRHARHSIVVIDLEGRPAVLLYTIDGPREPVPYRPPVYVVTVVSSELIVVTCNVDTFIYLVDVKSGKFVRNIVGEGDSEDEENTVGINTSLSRLQVVRKGPASQLTYVSHYFDA